jgi:DNA-binding PadR family transcriptional regulator
MSRNTDAQPPEATPSVEIQGLSRSCNEALLLAVLAGGPRHGYQLGLAIEETSGGAFRFPHGTLYPILHKLENEGLISGDWLEEGTKRKRKRYALTAAGRQRVAEQARAWRSFFERFFAIVGEVER